MSRENVELVRGGYDDFAAGNIDGVIARLDDDVEWVEPGGGNAPSGTFRGPDSVRDDVFSAVPQNFDDFTVAVEGVRDEATRSSSAPTSRARTRAAPSSTPRPSTCGRFGTGSYVRCENKVDQEAWARGWS